MHFGIDLGTTFCCMSYINENGIPKVIPNSLGKLTTPSIIYFDGKNAYVGEKANQRKILPNAPIFEFIKRDMGCPIEIPSGRNKDCEKLKPPKPYEINGFKYGPEGMSAIILRYLKKCALIHFKRNKLIDENVDEKNYTLDTVITVPAYFGDKERQATKLAGFAAGLNVVGLINEPTAASLTYGHSLQKNEKLMIFDLGGGTFDLTLLEICNGEAFVISSEGEHTLGGKNWDEVIQSYIINEYARRTNKEIPIEMLAWDVPQKALEAKLNLSDSLSTEVSLSVNDEDFSLTLYRKGDNVDEYVMEDNRQFFFDERSTDLLVQLKTHLERVLEKSRLCWEDLDDIVLAGGACRMPMIPALLENLTGKKIKKDRQGFNYDTAISLGAAIYGNQKSKVHDVASSTVGIKLEQNKKDFIEHLLIKGTHLPFSAEQEYNAPENAELWIYEGDSQRPDECNNRGKVSLENPKGKVIVNIFENQDGELKVTAKFQNGQKELKFQNDLYRYDERAIPLRDKVMSININL